MTRDDLHGYQLRAVNHITTNPNVALFLDMGLGKTVSTLTAITDLLEDFAISKVLVVAPLRVANSVWHKEAKLWSHTADLKFSIVTGSLSKRQVALQRKADVYVINRENIPWLVEKYRGKKFPFDMVVIDESSSFKNHAAKRFKALKKVLPMIDRMVLLTGTPSPNGYMDLWSQFYLLDSGERLGKNITMFRSRYFDKSFNGFSYVIRPDSAKIIQNKIKDLALSMQSEDYLELPEFIPTVLGNQLEGKLLKQYQDFEKDMMMDVGDDQVTAMSAATLSNKLLQFCSGNMYGEDEKIHHFHNLKVDTLKEIIEDNPADNILVAYNYKHEFETLVKNFPDAVVLDNDEKTVDAWNNGEIKMLLAHPASAGHGLNLQKGGSLMVWYGFTWSLELYQQFNKRLHRQGQTKPVRCLHIAVGEIEERLMKTLALKDVTQAELLHVLKGD